MKLTQLCKENGATILSGLGIAGVVSTAILAAKDTPKALEILAEKEQYKQENYGEPLTRFEKVLTMIPLYLPTIMMATATGACILGANHLNKVKQANLMAAYMYLGSEYECYRDKVKEIFGEEGEKRVREELKNDIYLHETYGSVDDKRLFYDEYSKRYFEMSLYEFQRNIYEVNRIYNHIGELSLNEFYEFFKLAPTELGEKIGWNGAKDWECYNFSWIEAHLVDIETPDNLQALGIVFNIAPSDDWQEW